MSVDIPKIEYSADEGRLRSVSDNNPGLVCFLVRAGLDIDAREILVYVDPTVKEDVPGSEVGTDRVPSYTVEQFIEGISDSDTAGAAIRFFDAMAEAIRDDGMDELACELDGARLTLFQDWHGR